jgi:hypothetical protein
MVGVSPDPKSGETDRQPCNAAFRRPLDYEPGFEIHASPEAIKHYIDKARKRAMEIQNELGWLEGLYLRRVAEKAAGEWPCSPS